jgi:hypothetical protein
MSFRKTEIEEHLLSTSLLRPTFLTVKQFCQRYPAFSHGGMRWLLFHRKENGLEHAVLKVGRKVLIDVDQFFVWLAQQNGRKRKPTTTGF